MINYHEFFQTVKEAVKESRDLWVTPETLNDLVGNGSIIFKLSAINVLIEGHKLEFSAREGLLLQEGKAVSSIKLVSFDGFPLTLNKSKSPLIV